MDHFHRLYIFRIIQALLADKHHLAGFLKHIIHIQTVSTRHRHRFLAEDMLSGMQGVYCDMRMFVQRSGDHDSLYISIIQKLPVIVICLGFRIESRSLFQVGRIIITQGNHIGIRNRLQVIQVVLSARTCTNKSDPHFLLCDLHLIVGTTGLQPGKRGKQHTASTNHSQLLEEVPPA